jgi:cytochrome c oxidase subunit 2
MKAARSIVRPAGRASLWAAIALAAGCDGMQTPLNPAGPEARTIATLTWWFFGICGFFFAATMAAVVWAVVRRRRPTDDSPDTERRLARVIASAMAVTILTLIGLSVYSVAAGRVLTPPPNAPLMVDVIGHQWWWEFQYRDPVASSWVNSPNELHIPVGVPVVLRATSADVIHSFWVPNLHGKRDLIPGMETHTWIQADAPGVYRGQCAEFCGQQHAHMALYVIAEPMDAFQRWLQHERQGAPQPSTPATQRGHDLFMSGPCAMCHSIRGTAAGSHVGPDLTHVAGRQTIAAGTLPMVEGHLAGWIADSQSVKPGNRMPPNLVPGADLQALVAYLETLK